MSEKQGVAFMKGNPLTLVGNEVKAGDKAPDSVLVGSDLSEIRLSSFFGRVLVLSAVPSLDTPVCDTETRRFNEEAARLGHEVKIVTVSMDLPFAQKRWCGAAGVENVVTLSDHRNASFGQDYGILIKGLRLLARAVFVVDKEGVVRYVQLVKEVADEPDYDKVSAEVKKLL